MERRRQMKIVYGDQKKIPVAELAELYGDSGWKVYTDRIDKLEKAFMSSLKIVSAWENGKLVGLARLVGDGVFIAYLQDILVRSDMRRKGIGSELFRRVFAEYETVRQKVLVTDNSQENIDFYESLGFKTFDKYELLGFMSFCC